MRESLRFGFEREGVAVAACGSGDSFDPDLFTEPAELVIAGGRTGDEARAILSLVRGVLAAAPRQPPVLYVGNGVSRPQALAEGATEFLGDPVFVRDAVTVAKLLAGRKRDNPSVLAGELGEHFGLFYLVRAVSALGRRGVVTLVRGMRRGELRFFDGEVTSAQVGLLHGLAALHQLLLWTEGRFEFRPEDVVRRQQIPLEPTELFADAERFLSEICAVADKLSPSACYERDDRQLGRVAGRIPPEVTSVLNLFDGVRTVADVVEDSQYRVFETLRIANRLCELRLLRLRFAAHPRHTAHSALAIEEWLIGDRAARGPGYAVVDRSMSAEEGGPPEGLGPGAVRERKRRKRRKGRPEAVDAAPAAGTGGLLALPARGGLAAHDEARHRADDGSAVDREREASPEARGAAPGERAVGAQAHQGVESVVVDWAQVLPGAVGSDLGVSPVVPSSVAAGEIGTTGASQEQLAVPVRVDPAEEWASSGDHGAGNEGEVAGPEAGIIAVRPTSRAGSNPVGAADASFPEATLREPAILGRPPGEATHGGQRLPTPGPVEGSGSAAEPAAETAQPAAVVAPAEPPEPAGVGAPIEMTQSARAGAPAELPQPAAVGASAETNPAADRPSAEKTTPAGAGGPAETPGPAPDATQGEPFASGVQAMHSETPASAVALHADAPGAAAPARLAEMPPPDAPPRLASTSVSAAAVLAPDATQAADAPASLVERPESASVAAPAGTPGAAARRPDAATQAAAAGLVEAPDGEMSRPEKTSPPLFSASDEAFFAQGEAKPPEPDSFDDLDDAYLPRSFWRRLFRGPVATPLAESRPGGKSRKRRRR